MLKLGTKCGQVYNAKQVKAVRDELKEYAHRFPLDGDIDIWELGQDEEETSLPAPRRSKARIAPDSYPAAAFVEVCRAAASEIAKDLMRLCLDPATCVEAGFWYFANLGRCLRDCLISWTDARSQGVVTELGRQVRETLDYSLASRCLTIIEGDARTGKTFAATAWCEQNPGRARYVQVPSSSDDAGFYRAIARSLGVSINLNSKAHELRDRIEDVLQSGDLLLCLDEAHYLWPHSNYREALPHRVNWVMTALVNHRVPVCLITTPQFQRMQKRIEERTRWTSEQFIGRIGHYQKLPGSLSENDLAAVAKSLLPEGDTKSLQLLVAYAISSAKYLAAIESIVRRARYLVGNEDRSNMTLAHVKRAIRDSVIPSDNALAEAFGASARTILNRDLKGAEKPLQTSRTTAARMSGGEDLPVEKFDGRNGLSRSAPVMPA